MKGKTFIKKSKLRLTFLAINFVAVSQIPVACIYPKVVLTKTEKKLIPYGTKKTFSIFKCNEIQDTVYFRMAGYRNGYLPNFDHWCNKKVWNDTSTKRGLFHTVFAQSNFPRNKYTDNNLDLMYLRISFVKEWDNDNLRLSIDNFEKSYTLNEQTSDTLIFQRPADKPCKECETRILWAKDKGIIQIEKNDGAIWKIVMKD